MCRAMLAGANSRPCSQRHVVGQIADGQIRNAPTLKPVEKMGQIAPIRRHRVLGQVALAGSVGHEAFQPRLARGHGPERFSAEESATDGCHICPVFSARGPRAEDREPPGNVQWPAAVGLADSDPSVSFRTGE